MANLNCMGKNYKLNKFVMQQKRTQIRLILPFLLMLSYVLSSQVAVDDLEKIAQLYPETGEKHDTEHMDDLLRNFLLDFSDITGYMALVSKQKTYNSLNEGILSKVTEMKKIISGLTNRMNSHEDLSKELLNLFTCYQKLFQEVIPVFVQDFFEPIKNLVSKETTEKVNLYSRYKVDIIHEEKLKPTIWTAFDFLSIFGIAFSEVQFLSQEEEKTLEQLSEFAELNQLSLDKYMENYYRIVIDVKNGRKIIQSGDFEKLFEKQTDMYKLRIFHLVLARQLMKVTDSGAIGFFNYKQLSNIVFDLFFFHVLDASMASAFFEILFESLLKRRATLADPVCSFILLHAKIGNKLNFFTQLLTDLRKKTYDAILTSKDPKADTKIQDLFRDLVLAFSFLYQQILTVSWHFKSAEIFQTVSDKKTTLKSEIAKGIHNNIGKIFTNGLKTFCKASIEGLVEGFSHAGEVAKNSGYTKIATVC